ncbi:EamA family transporter [Campylobacter sp. RM12327]|uniref:DMT family transporter n=1 Tax=Campylobacter sputorum TaxID=206 RepID=UPI00053BE4A3|nr:MULTISPECIES: EamA family transporter [Campylobacter]MBF6669317.1 EamA family transporter [Campylobacter sp. RM12327]MBF6674586.1 EamA family transporter [Campylobacter sp. RM13538]MBF6678435.1 EamA family transporter [Campylobacter sp. RM11259]
MLHRFLMRNLGAYYMVLASFYFALTGAFAKLLSSSMSSVEVSFFRNIVGLAIIVVTIYKYGAHNKGGKPFILFLRGFLGTISMLAFFHNIAHIGLAEAFTFTKMSPMFLAIFGVILFKERLNLLSWFGIIFGFIGILLIMQPNLGFKMGHAMGLINGLLAAVAYLSVHELRKYYDTKTIVLSFMLSGTLIPIVCMLVAQFIQTPPFFNFMFAKFIMPTPSMWVFIVLMGVGGLLFQTYMTKAYAASRYAGAVAAIGYCDVIFTMIIGFIMGDSLPNLMAFFGIIIVIISGVIVATQK